MSGIEAIGFVLAAIPLVISAVEHYRDGLDVLVNYAHYQSTLKALRTRLRIQLNLYQGTLKRLLLSELSSTEADELFPTIDAPSKIILWGTQEIEEKLRRKLGQQYQIFMDVIWEMDVVMKMLMNKLDIDLEGKVFYNESRNNLDLQLTLFFCGKPKWTTTPGAKNGQRNTRIEWEWRKIRRSFGKKERERLIQSFEMYNNNIASFVQNNEILAPQTEPRTKSLMSHFDTARNYTLSLYETVENSWKCESVHSVSLRIDNPGKIISGKKSGTFHMYFSSCQSNTLEDNPETSWTETVVAVDRSDGSATLGEVTPSTQNPEPDPQSNNKIASAQRLTPTARLIKWYKQSDPKDQNDNSIGKVRFDKQPDPLTRSITIKNERLIDCLCSAIKTSPKIPKSLVVISPDHCLSTTVATIAWHTKDVRKHINLGRMIVSKSGSTSESRKQGKLSRQKRLELAVTLASIVLQFYDSPWLNDLWSKQDISFFLSGIDTENRPSISEPFITQAFPAKSAVPMPTQLKNEAANQFLSHLILNKTLFALGIVLIELCLNKPFEDLHTGRPPTNKHQTSVADDYQVAINNIDDVYAKGGTEYGYVVQRCLRCEFPVQDSKKRLDLDTFRILVYEGVVAPLEKDYKKYSLYYGSSS